MRQFRGTVRLGLAGCEVGLEFEVEDDATEAEIEEATREAAMEHVDYWADEVTGEGS